MRPISPDGGGGPASVVRTPGRDLHRWISRYAVRGLPLPDSSGGGKRARVFEAVKAARVIAPNAVPRAGVAPAAASASSTASRREDELIRVVREQVLASDPEFQQYG